MISTLFSVIGLFLSHDETYIKSIETLTTKNGKESYCQTIISIDNKAVRILKNDNFILNIENTKNN